MSFSKENGSQIVAALNNPTKCANVHVDKENRDDDFAFKCICRRVSIGDNIWNSMLDDNISVLHEASGKEAKEWSTDNAATLVGQSSIGMTFFLY